jgi:hypothetical protein
VHQFLPTSRPYQTPLIHIHGGAHFGSFSISQPTGFLDRYSMPIWSVLSGACHHWRQFFGSAAEKS